MSDPDNQNEPTMEEILASIRRIISEDGTEAEEGAADDEAPAEAAEETAEPDPDPEPEPAAEEAAPEPADEEEDDDVLDLTQMVGEDGSVVDLAKEREAAMAAESGEASEPEPTETSEEEADLEVDLQEPSAESEPEPEPELEAEAEAMPEPELEATSAPVDQGLLSDPTKDAATSSLMALTSAAGMAENAGQASLSGGLTLEQLVREALEPYLKTWLDENLAPLVERIVREEIQKLVKRAEYR